MKKRRQQSQIGPEERALLSVMSDYPLKPGQMLLLGPKSVHILTSGMEWAGPLPDKHIYEKVEWKR